MKVIYTGLESSGKSLRLAKVVEDLCIRNYKWKKQSGVVRPIASNMVFSEDFYNEVTRKLGLPIIYWDSIGDLINLKDADVIMDEIGNYFDSRLWADLGLDERRWLTQGAKMGIEIYGSAQDFAQVDKSFRRLVNELYEVKKLFGSPRPSATKPPVKTIWGVCIIQKLDPNGYNEDKKDFSRYGFPSFFTIRRKYCEIFDTNQEIKRSAFRPLRHEIRKCIDPTCTFHKTVHI